MTYVVCDDALSSGRHGQFQNMVIRRIRQAGTPKKINLLVLAHLAQRVEQLLDILVGQPHFYLVSPDNILIFKEQSRRKHDPDRTFVDRA